MYAQTSVHIYIQDFQYFLLLCSAFSLTK